MSGRSVTEIRLLVASEKDVADFTEEGVFAAIRFAFPGFAFDIVVASDPGGPVDLHGPVTAKDEAPFHRKM